MSFGNEMLLKSPMPPLPASESGRDLMFIRNQLLNMADWLDRKIQMGDNQNAESAYMLGLQNRQPFKGNFGRPDYTDGIQRWQARIGEA